MRDSPDHSRHEIRHLNSHTNTEKAEEAINKDYPDVSNLKLGVTFVNNQFSSSGEKCVTVPGKTASHFLHCNKINI